MLELGNQPGASRLTSVEALSMRVSKSNSESPDGVLMSLFQRGKSFESGSGVARVSRISLFSTVYDVLANTECVVAGDASVAESFDDAEVTR